MFQGVNKYTDSYIQLKAPKGQADDWLTAEQQHATN